MQLQYNAEIQQFIDSNFMFPFLGLKNNLYLILTYLIFSPTKNSEISNFYLILNVFSRYYLVSEHFFSGISYAVKLTFLGGQLL